MSLDRTAAPDPSHFRSHTQEDLLAKGGKALLAFVGVASGAAIAGPIGAVLGDLLVELIPRQRQDRFQEFAELLHERIGALEVQFKERIHSSESFSSLVEQAVLSAVRSHSEQRRRDLAELLRTGLSRSEAELVEHEMLLQILNRLNDPQLIILVRHGGYSGAFGDPRLQEFIDAHPEVFVYPPAMAADDVALRRWAMFSAYEDDLVSQGLLHDREGMAKSSTHTRVLEITALGTMLLEAIGRFGDAP